DGETHDDRHLAIALADRLLLAADDDAVAVGNLESGESGADRVVHRTDVGDFVDDVAREPEDAVLVLTVDGCRRDGRVDAGDIAQIDGRATGNAGEERDRSDVLGAGELLARQTHAQVVLLVAGREARRDRAVERSADRLADRGDVQAEIRRALAVQLDRELWRSLIGGCVEVLEARNTAQPEQQLLADATQLVQVVAGDRECDRSTGRVRAKTANARRPHTDAGAGEAA